MFLLTKQYKFRVRIINDVKTQAPPKSNISDLLTVWWCSCISRLSKIVYWRRKSLPIIETYCNDSNYYLATETRKYRILLDNCPSRRLASKSAIIGKANVSMKHFWTVTCNKLSWYVFIQIKLVLFRIAVHQCISIVLQFYILPRKRTSVFWYPVPRQKVAYRTCAHPAFSRDCKRRKALLWLR